MKIHFDSNQNLGEKRFDAFSEQKVHYKMFKAGKRWLYAGIFMLSMGAGMVGLGGNVAQADTTAEADSTSTDQTVKTPADTGTYTLKSSETATTDQSTTAKGTTDAANADQQSDTATATNSNNTDSTQASTTTGDKSASTAISTTSSVKASTAVSSGTTDNTTQTASPKKAADVTDDSASTNLTNNTAAAQQSSVAISDGDKTNVNASSVSDSTLKMKPDTSQEETGTDAKTATLKATATSVTSDGQELSTDKLTEATADTYATLQQIKTATAGMTQEELISYVTAHNNAAKAANGGTIFVVSDSGDIIPVKSKAGTYTADFTYKSTDGTELADSITKSTTLDNAASLLVEPPFIPGYQLDMDASKINVYSSVGEAQTISSYINTLNSIQSIPGYSLIAKPLNISSFQQLLDAIGAMLGVHLQDTGISWVTSLFGADSPTTSQTGHFDYVYKKTNSSIETQPQTVSVGATVPTMSSFVKNAKDDAGNDVSTELTSPDYTNLSTATAGAKTFTLEYFNMKNLEFIQAQATLNVVNPVTTNVVTVNSQTIGYGTDKGIGSDYGFTVSQTGNDTQINVPTNLDSSDFSIQNASYSKSNHLNVSASPYTIAINPAGISKFSAANPDVVLDSTTNFASGKLTVTPAKLTITADNLSKNAGEQDPALTYTTDGLVDGDSVSATVTRAAGEDVGKYNETVTDNSKDANYDVTTAPGTFTITKKATQSIVNVTDTSMTYGDDAGANSDYGFKVTVNGDDITIPTLTASDFTIDGAQYTASDHLKVVRPNDDETKVGTYKVELSAAGKSKIEAANPDVTLSDANFLAGTLTVNPRNATITINPSGKLVGQPDPNPLATVNFTGVVDGDTLDYALTRTGQEQPGQYTLSVNLAKSATNDNYNVYKMVSNYFTIRQATNSDLFQAAPYQGTGVADYGSITKDTPLNFTLEHQGSTLKGATLDSSDFSFFSMSPATYSKGGYLNVNQYAIVINANGKALIRAANPGITISDSQFMMTYLTVTPISLNVVPKEYSKLYNTADPDMTATITDGVLPGDDPLTYTVTRTPGETIGSGYLETAKLDKANANYAVTFATDEHFQIIAAPITDTLTLPAVDGGTYGDPSSSLVINVQPTHTGNQLLIPQFDATDYKIIDGVYTNGQLNAGTYHYGFSDAGMLKLADDGTNKNYDFGSYQFPTGTITVAPKAATIAADNLSKTYGSSDPTLTATPDGVLAADVANLNYTVTRDKGEAVGSYQETVQLGDNPNYTFATPKQGTFTITGQTISATYTVVTYPVTYGDISKQSGLSTGVTYYTDNDKGLQLSRPALTATDFKIVANDSDYSTGGYLNAGSYQVVFSEAGIQKIKNANPTLALTDTNFAGATLVVGRAQLTLTANNASKYAGDTTDPELTATLTGVKLGDTVTVPTTATREAGEAMGTYAITPTYKSTDFTNPNYTLTVQNGLFEIKVKTSTDTVIPNDVNATYGDDKVPAGTNGSVTLSNILPNATISFKDSGTDFSMPDGLTADDVSIDIDSSHVTASGHLAAGSYDLTINDSGIAKLKAANPGYQTIATGLGHLIIGKKAVTVTASDATKVYNGANGSDPALTFTTNADKLLTSDGVDITVKREAGNDVGTYAITASEADSTNYTFTNKPGTFTITPATTTGTVSVSQSDVQYGNDLTPTLTTADGSVLKVDGIGLTADDYQLSNTTKSTSGNYVVGDYTITLTKAGLDKLQNANKNYTLTMVNVTPGSFKITQKPLTITPQGASKVFGDSDPAYTAKLDGLVGTDKVDYTVNRADAGTAAGESVGTHDLTVTNSTTVDSGNYKITLATGALVITALALTGTVTVTTKDKTYGDITKDGDAGFGITLEGHTLDTSTLTPEDYTISAKDTDYSGKYLEAGNYTVTLNDAGKAALAAANPNFDFSKVTFKTGNLTVAQIKVGLGVFDASKTYGQKDPYFQRTIGPVILDSQDTRLINVIVTREPGEDVGTYKLTTSLSPNRNYIAVFAGTATFTITPATISATDTDAQVKPNDQSITFGQTPAGFDATFGKNLNKVDLTNADFEFTNNKDQSVSTSVPTDVGEYTISLTAAAQTAIAKANPNYTFTSDAFLKGIFTINPKATVANDATTEITPDSQTITFGETPADFTATFGDKLNKVTLTNEDFTFKQGTTIENGVPTDAGIYEISLTAAAQTRIKNANPNYTFSNADFKTGTFTINPKKTTAGDETTQVTVNDQSKVYGDPTPTFDLTYGNKLNAATDLTNADFSFKDSKNNAVSGVPENVGDYTVSLNASGQAKVQAANGNYTLTTDDFKAGNFTITAKSTTPNDATTEVTADSQTITFGDTPKAFTVTFGDKLNHVTLTNADFTFTKGTTTENGVPTDAGSYEISLTGDAQARIKAANPNYTFSTGDFKTGTFLINPKTTTDGDETTQVTPNSQTITFGDTPDAFTATFGDKLNKVTLTNADFVFTKGTTAENGVPTDAGSYEISLTDAAQIRIKNANPNYTFSNADFKTGTFLINPKTTKDDDVTTQVTPNNQTITFGDTPGAFTATFGSNLNEVTLANDDFTFTDNKTHMAVTGIPKNAGSYEISLTADAQTRIKTANPNYTFSAGSFKTGTFTIKPKNTTADDVTTQVKVNDHSIVYGDQTPNFDLTYGNKLTAATGLTNFDFSFTDGDGNLVTGVPENVGVYTVSLNASGQVKVQAANGNYTLTSADFLTGTFTITAKATTPNDSTTEVTADSQKITFGDTPKAFTATFGSKLNSVDLTNDDFVFTVGTTTVDGVPTAAGTYTISLTTAAQNRIKAANPNYKFSDTDFKTGTFLINPKTTTDGDETTQAKVNDQSKVYGDKDPNFDLTYGDKLTAPTNLTNADFSFTDGDGNQVTGIPENVGTYTVSLNADGQSKIQAANGNYTLTADDFKTGTFTITAKSTTQNDATTEVTANGQTITFGETPKAFTATFGDKLNHVTLTDADFTFTDNKTSTETNGVPTNAGSYKVSLTADAQTRIKAANPNYMFSNTDFKTGTFTINPKATTPDDVTTQAKVNDQSKVYGDKDPNFDLTYGDKLTAPKDLTNADFSFKDSDNNTVTDIPENVGTYTVSLNANGQAKVQAANENYTLTADDFKTGTFTITAKSTTPDDATTEVTPDSQTITFGDTPKAFTATFGNKLNEVKLTNDDFTFTDGKTTVNGVPTNAGSYTISLTTTAQNRIKAANPNYTFSVGDFKTGTFTINPKATTGDDATTQAKVNDQSKVYGDKDPNFDLTYGDNLTAPTDLTNADFSFTDSKSHAVDGVPENVGTYTVSLSANGQAKVQAANGNYTLTADDFKTGTFTITAKPTTSDDVTTQAKVNNQSKVYGDKDPNFDLTYGDKLTAPTDLTNADFSFTDSKGNAVKGVPENVGTYTISLNANGQAKVQAANGNYTLTADDFKTGTFTITAKPTTPDDVTTQAKVNNQAKVYGDKDPNFDLNYGEKLTAPIDLTNADFSFTDSKGNAVDGVPENVGTYTVSLNATGQAKVQAANGNYALTADDFKTGTFTITAKSTTPDDATTEVTPDSQTITFGDTPADFTATFGDKLNKVTLSNDDFTFKNGTTTVTGVPTNAGSYEISLTASAQARIEAANPNYTFSAGDFKTGTFTINPKATTSDDATTQAKVNDQSKVYGDKDPNFDLAYGDKLNVATDLTNADFSFKDSKGNAVSGIPENVGTYTISLNADGQAKVQAANRNYTLTADDFLTGTFTITAKSTTKDDVTTEAKVNDQTKVYGDKDPNFDLAYGDKLTAATNLTNADFNFTDSKNHAVDGVPENVGTYTVSLNADGQAKVQAANGNYTLTADDFKTGTFTITAKPTTPDDATTQVTIQNEIINEGDPVPTFTVSYGSKLINHPVLTNADFSFDGSDTIPTTAGIYTVTLNALGKKAVQDANPNYALTDADFVSGTFTINKVTTDPDGGKTITKTDGSGAIIQIEKDWSDGDKTVVDIDTDTNVATVTETPNSKPSLTPVTVKPGESVKTGKTTVANNEPTDGVSLTHDAPGTATDGTPTTGTTGEVVTPDGTRTYFKSSNGEGVSTTPDKYYTTGTTDDPFGGKTITKTDGSGAITQIEKDWPDGDKTVVDIDTDTNVVTVTETPKGKPSLTPVTVQPGESVKTGKTTVTNNEPNNGVGLTHDEPGTSIDGTPTGGTIGEVVTPDGKHSYFKSSNGEGVSTTPENYYTTGTTDDPFGGKTITKTDGSGAIIQIEKDWPDGDKTVVDIDKTTGNAVVTETPKGQPSLTPVSVAPGKDITVGKTTVANNEPNGGITLTHETPGTATDGTPTTGTTGEVVTPDGKHSYFKSSNGEGVSTTADDYYTNTTTEDPNGGRTITKTDGSGSIVQIEKDWPDGDKTVVDIDTDTNVVTVTETPKGQPSLTPVTVQPGDTGKAGKTTVANNEPNGGVTLTHDTTGTDTNGNPTTGTTGEVITPDGTKTYFKTLVPDGVSTTKDDYYTNIITDDPNGGKTITKTDGSGSIVQIEKDWPDGDKTVVDIDTDTNVVTVTETPSGQPSLTPVTIQPGDSDKTGKTTVTNNEPDGVTLGHDTTGTDTNGNPTTGTTGETVTTPDGTRTYFKTQVTGGVSTPADGYYVTTTTTDVDGGQTKTTVDGSGAVTQVDKIWPDGDQTVVVIDKTGNAVFTETPNGQPSLPSQTVTPGGTATIGGTTLVNNEPTGGIQLTHQTTGSTIVETVDHGGSVNVVVTPNNNGGDNSISTDTGAGTGTGTTTPETPTNGGDNTTTGVDKGTGTETESTHGQTTTGGSSTGSTGSTGVVNTTVAQGQAVSGKQATVAGMNSHVSDQTQQADAQGKLPQTNENESAAGATIGLSLLGLLAALGFKRKKRDDE